MGAALLAAALVVPSFLLDRPAHRERRSLEFTRDLEPLGRAPGFIGVPALFYAGGALARSDRAKKVGLVALEAAAADGLATAALKCAFGRSRPYAGDGPGTWHPFSTTPARTAFPSGHTSTAFAVASVVAEGYDSLWVDAASYGLATGVGLSRIADDKHWASDVAAGAALGILVGKAVWRWEDRKGLGRRWYTDGRGLYVAQRF